MNNKELAELLKPALEDYRAVSKDIADMPRMDRHLHLIKKDMNKGLCWYFMERGVNVYDEMKEHLFPEEFIAEYPGHANNIEDMRERLQQRIDWMHKFIQDNE